MPVSKHSAAQAYIAELTKLANPVPTPGMADAAMKALQLSALALPLAAAGGHLISTVYAKMTAASHKANAFKSMMEQNPHLHDRDQATVQRYFNTLYHVNPHLAHEPTIAASYVNNMLTTSDPAKAMQPHRDVYQTALSAGGRGGMPQNPGAAVALESMSRAVGTLHKTLETSDAQRKAESANQRLREAQNLLRHHGIPF